MTKASTSFRLSDLTLRQLQELSERWGMTKTETISVIVDRAYRQEGEMARPTRWEYGRRVEDPKLYRDPVRHEQVIGYGSDGKWYSAPITEGGWDSRELWQGDPATLIPLTRNEEATIMARIRAGFDFLAALERPWLAVAPDMPPVVCESSPSDDLR